MPPMPLYTSIFCLTDLPPFSHPFITGVSVGLTRNASGKSVRRLAKIRCEDRGMKCPTDNPVDYEHLLAEAGVVE